MGMQDGDRDPGTRTSVDVGSAGADPVGDHVDVAVDDDPTARIPHDEIHYRDWGWVEEWRAQREGPAWAPGITMALFVAGLVAVALIVLTSGLSDTWWLAVVVNLVIAAGMAPALWLSRDLPVLRFLAAGAAVGLMVGWLCMLVAFPSWS